MSGYDHTQRSPLWLILLATGLTMLAAPWLASAPTPIWIVLWAAGALIIVLALGFRHLRVHDTGDALVIRYGPMSVVRKRFPYAKMVSAEAGRSSILDGWGIHYMPRLGWIYNLWGFGCVIIRMGPKTVRIGTDDPQGLADFLTKRIAEESARQGR